MPAPAIGWAGFRTTATVAAVLAIGPTTRAAGQLDGPTALQGRPLELGVTRGPGAWLGIALRDVTTAEAERWRIERGGAVIARTHAEGTNRSDTQDAFVLAWATLR